MTRFTPPWARQIVTGSRTVSSFARARPAIIPLSSWHSSPFNHPTTIRDVLPESCRNRFQSSSSLQGSPSITPSPGVQCEADFFGEPITFLDVTTSETDVGQSMEALDAFVVATVTKGKSCEGGGDEEGLYGKAAHSVAIAWAELLRNTKRWNHGISRAPMLVVAAVCPILVQANVGYLHTVDSLLEQACPRVDEGSNVRLVALAQAAASVKDHPNLTSREQLHLEALHFLLRHEQRKALNVLLKLLQYCPGDALALSFALDLANAVGDRTGALRAAGSVAAYWHERGGKSIYSSTPGYFLGSSLIAFGFAAGGRFSEAERRAEMAMNQDVGGCGGLASWVLAHVYDAEGRTSEGVSVLAGSDGMENYEGCGLLFFDSRLGGYGARFSLDREGAFGGRTALRLYDACYDRVFQYSGYASGQPWKQPQRMAPKAKSQRITEAAEKGARSLFHGLFGGSQQNDVQNEAKKLSNTDAISHESRNDSQKPTIEDIFSWLPPTPQLLADATLLLLRLTINGTVQSNDHRWNHLRHAWATFLSVNRLDGTELEHCVSPMYLPPLVAAAASLLFDPPVVKGGSVPTRYVASGLRIVGELLHLRESDTNLAEIDLLSEKEQKERWVLVTKYLSSARNGLDPCHYDLDPRSSLEFDAWEIDARPILSHLICHAACSSEDVNSLCIARSVCSQGVSLRPNCPDEWWRYSVVLESLGDEVAAEGARSASISLGLGEGVTRSHRT